MLHTESIESLFRKFKSSPEGLSDKEALQRIQDFGPNQIARHETKNYRIEYLKEYISFFPILLEIAALLALVADDFDPGKGNDILAYAIFTAVFINASFSFWQKFKADKAMEALLKLIRSEAQVVRSGKIISIDSQEVVPGDILLLTAGDKVTADAVLYNSNDLYLNLSVLNGESTPSQRTTDPDNSKRALEAKNLVFAGSSVSSGNGSALVFATGEATEFGKIARLTAEVGKTLTPIEKEIRHMTQLLTILAIATGLAFFFLGWFSDRELLISAIFALSLIVANVPEGLLPTITLSLSLASQRMARRQALIKNLNSVETLGSATVICTDKTGTLTQNEMTVDKLWLAGNSLFSSTGKGYFSVGSWHKDSGVSNTVQLNRLLQIAAINTHAEIDPTTRTSFGDPTEIALVAALLKTDASVADWEKVREYTFTSDRKMMSTLVKMTGSPAPRLCTKGALEAVLPLCTHWRSSGGSVEMSAAKRSEIEQQNMAFAEKAYRVLAIAEGSEETEANLCFLGLIALIDPPREGVKEAIAQCHSAEIKVMMITGDNPVTAQAIASKIGLRVDQVYTGPEIEALSDKKLRDKLRDQHILFTRMASAQKLRITRLLQDNNEIVAMTGDGVNDSPALKQADIGIAMGSGTDVAKEAGDMILLDDNFKSIVAAVEEGRNVYFNIKKITTYILSSNIPEIVPYILSFFLKIPIPLSVIQILLIDLGTDQIPGLGLGSERPEKQIMQRPPVGRNERILDWEVFKRGYFINGMFEGGAAMFAFLGFLFFTGWHYGDLSITDEYHRQAMTMTLLGAISCQITNVFTLRSWENPIWSLQGSNRLIWFGVGTELIFVLLILYVPMVQHVFNTATVPFQYLGLLIPFPLLLFLNHERYKRNLRNKTGEV